MRGELDYGLKTKKGAGRWVAPRLKNFRRIQRWCLRGKTFFDQGGLAQPVRKINASFTTAPVNRRAQSRSKGRRGKANGKQGSRREFMGALGGWQLGKTSKEKKSPKGVGGLAVHSASKKGGRFMKTPPRYISRGAGGENLVGKAEWVEKIPPKKHKVRKKNNGVGNGQKARTSSR